MATEPQYKSVDKFDRAMGELAGLPDTISTRPSPHQVNTPFIGGAQVFVIQTYRQREVGDFIFVSYMDDKGSVRLVLPPEVADAIARQRESLGKKNRKRAAKEEARRRKAAGIQPGFMNGRKRAKAQKGKVDDGAR